MREVGLGRSIVRGRLQVLKKAQGLEIMQTETIHTYVHRRLCNSICTNTYIHMYTANCNYTEVYVTKNMYIIKYICKCL